jgi:dolichyl-phosphate beta-glucosyltransferase
VHASLVIPMFEEASRIERTIALLAEAGLGGSTDLELIFVDDGSTDQTVETCRRSLDAHGLTGRVLALPTNQGKGAAVRHGVLAAFGDVVAFSDADLSCPTGDVRRVIDAVSGPGVDVAIASRTDRGSLIVMSQPWYRRWSGQLFNRELRLLGLTRFTDTQCGLKAFRRDVAMDLFGPLTTKGFAFDVEILARADRRGYTTIEVPVTWAHVEASRVDPIRDGLRMAFDAARISWRLARERSRASAPLRSEPR